MNILVLATDYPDNEGKVSLMYIHTRNIQYVKYHDVTVLNFSAKKGYSIDGIRVITEAEFYTEKKNYDLVLSHAANVRMHYRFLKKNRFSNVVFFFHGHEVLRINKVYPKPYPYRKKSFIKRALQNGYDTFKFHVWRKYFKKNLKHCHFVFVSQWMKNEFEKWIMPTASFEERTYITYNGISKAFESGVYDFNGPKEFDFITIRSFLDGSKYCVDIVCDLARNNPEYQFCIIGKGEFFNHYQKPDNVVWLDRNMQHTDILSALNTAKCALMPTRTDAQGLMACEIASTGMPLVTSDIDVCHEIFDDFSNVAFMDNEDLSGFQTVYRRLTEECISPVKNEKYFTDNTIRHELEIFDKIVHREEKL